MAIAVQEEEAGGQERQGSGIGKRGSNNGGSMMGRWGGILRKKVVGMVA